MSPGVAETPKPVRYFGRSGDYLWFDDDALVWVTRNGDYVDLDDAVAEVSRVGDYVLVEVS